MNSSKLKKDIEEFCKMNDIENVEEFTLKCTLMGFNICKYGNNPGDNIKKETEQKDSKKRKITITKK